MKYQRLVREQLEELHGEFAKFLAVQSIDAVEWNAIKSKNPKLVEEQIDVFSDLVWDKILTDIKYLELFCPQKILLARYNESDQQFIRVQIAQKGVDLQTKSGHEWLKSNLHSDEVLFYGASKLYNDKNKDKFEFMREGAVPTKGELFAVFEKILKPA